MKKYIVGLVVLVLCALGYGAATRVINADQVKSNAAGTSGTLVLPTSGTVTIPNGTATVTTNDNTQTLTNKTIDGNDNTLQDIPLSAITGSASLLETDFSNSLINVSWPATLVEIGDRGALNTFKVKDASVSMDAGNLLVVSGNSGYSGRLAGSLNLFGGDASVSGISGGAAILGGGSHQSNGNGGSASVIGGSGAGAGVPGAANLYAGSNPDTSEWGDVNVIGKDIDIESTSSVNLKVALWGTAAPNLRFHDDDNSNYVAFKSPGTLSANTTYTWPSADGTVGQVLATNGSGTLSWVTGGGGGGGVSPLTTNGDLFTHNGSSDVRLGIGSVNQFLTVGTGSPAIQWSSTLTGATINADSNTITNIENADIKSGAAIDAAKLHDGSISNTEFGFLNGIVSALCGISDSCTLTNKTIDADLNTVSDIDDGEIKAAAGIDATKLGGGAVSNTEFGFLDGVLSALCGITDTCTLTNKTIDADVNTIADIDNNEIKAAAAIDATKIADGSVTSTEFQYIGTLTSNAQTQLDAKVAKADYTTSGDVLVGTGSGTYSAVGATDQNTNNSIVRRDSGGAAEFTTIKNGLGNIVYDPVGGQIRSISGTLLADHSGTSFITYGPVQIGNATNGVSSPLTTFRTTTAAAGGTSHTWVLPPANRAGSLVNDGSGNLSWGASGSGSFNYIENPGWEVGTSDWTASGGSYARTTTAANVGSGIGAATWDSNASSQTLTSDAITIAAGAYGQNGVVSCKFQTPSGTATHLLQAWDGTNVIASQTITSATTYPRTNVNFVFPSSGTIAARIVSVNSNEPSISIDDCYLGLAEGFNVSQVSQAQVYGTATQVGAANCNFTQNTSTSDTDFVDLGTAGSCAQAWTTTGNVSAVGATSHQITLTNAPPGNYLVMIDAQIYQTGSATACTLRMSDGTDVISGATTHYISSGLVSMPIGISGSVTYTTAGTRTFKLQAADSGTTTCGIYNEIGGRRLQWKVYRFPTSAETAIAANVNSAGGTAVYPNGAGKSVAGTSTSWTTFSDADFPTGRTFQGQVVAPSTSNDLGVQSAGVLPAGRYLVVFTGPLYNSMQGATTSTTCNFAISDGTTRGPVIDSFSIDDGTHEEVHYLNQLSATFEYSSAAQRNFVVQYRRQSGDGFCGADMASRENAASMTIIPLSQNLPVPILVGSVTSNSTGAERVERLRVGLGTDCTASPCTISQSGSWVSSVTRGGTGTYTVNIASGMFSAAPTCECSAFDYSTGGNYRDCGVFNESTSTISIVTGLQTSSAVFAAEDGTFNLICQGPR